METQTTHSSGKNIIVCADGTGNAGGYTPDSNVYRIYKAVDKRFTGDTTDNFHCREQIVFYDNGVGTQKNRYIRALSGGLGFGFERNVCDLYTFLARNYEPGDRIWFFGFSRGASTVRACNGMISICGLVKGAGLRNRELTTLVDEAFSAYKQHEQTPERANMLKESERSHGSVPIHFLGVWDTVVALGFPSRTDVTGTVSGWLNDLFIRAEAWLDRKWPHQFYHYRLTDNVVHACQALAIDDERTAFWPHVWREEGRPAGSVEQVWFAGMHSNVGGGYERSGMASVPLYWMMLRAQRYGLHFEEGRLQEALNDSHIHGRMYHSRDGLGLLYRYHPREIEKLCEGRISGDIKLHRSVIERINHRTANYAPGQLPARFAVVDDDPDAPAEIRNPGRHYNWNRYRSEINTWVHERKCLYERMLSFALLFLIAGFGTWLMSDGQPAAHSGLFGYVADLLDYLIPGFLEPLVHIIVYQHPWILLLLAMPATYYYKRMRAYRQDTIRACENLRNLVITEEHHGDALVEQEHGETAAPATAEPLPEAGSMH